MIKRAYPEDVSARSSVFRWHRAFFERREDLANEVRAGRSSTSSSDDKCESTFEYSPSNECSFSDRRSSSLKVLFTRLWRTIFRRGNTVDDIIVFALRQHQTILQLLYSPDVAPSPSDLFLSPRLKEPVKIRHFGTIWGIQEACTAALKDIPEKVHRDVFDACKSLWRRCIGEYLEIF